MTTLARAAGLTFAATGLLAVLNPTSALAKGDPGVRLTAQISGANEVGGPAVAYPQTVADRTQGVGDPDGSGTVTLTVRPSTGQVCYTISTTNLAPLKAAHLHNQVAGQNGPIDVQLYGGSGPLSGCVQTDVETARSIVAHPDQYYANVHNAEFPGGAARAQLRHDHH